jgi:hypothetical protein
MRGGPTADFWSVQRREEEELRDLSHKLEGTERALNLAKRILAIRNAPGFQDFVDAVNDLQQHADRQLVGCLASDSYMRHLQGKAQALRDVMALLSRTENTATLLARQQKDLQNALDAARERRPKPRSDKEQA